MNEQNITKKVYKITNDESINKKFAFLLNEMDESRKGNRPFELYIFAWSLIEEILLPELIKFVAKNLKFPVPKTLFKSRQISLNLFYLALSGGDNELFDKLERSRKTRNVYIHNLITSENLIDMNLKLKKATSDLVDIIELIKLRQMGKSPIPSVNRYYKGWNDAISTCLEAIKKHNS